MTTKKPSYWVVGASWGGSNHQDKRFVENSMWMLGWEKGGPDKLAKKINIGDRIAIKRMKGRGKSEICILHIGIVKGVIKDTSNVVCAVDWVATDLKRDVPSRGFYKSIHGPVTDIPWLNEAFRL